MVPCLMTKTLLSNSGMIRFFKKSLIPNLVLNQLGSANGKVLRCESHPPNDRLLLKTSQQVFQTHWA